jgi:hypothetical protein
LFTRTDAEGTLLRALVGDREWFVPWTESVTPREPADGPPSPNLFDLSLDAEGRLWVLIGVAGDAWQEAFDWDARDGHGYPRLHDDDRRHNYRDTILEVIDLETGGLLARERFHRAIGGFVEPGLAFRSWIDPVGVPRTELIPVRLEERGESTAR